MNRPITLLFTCSIIAACGGGGETSTAPKSPSGNIGVDDYDKLTAGELEAKVLNTATDESLSTHLKNGLRLNIRIGDAASTAANDTFRVAESAAMAAAQDSEFSSTNTHVRGVDESDFVKYDGQYLYMATQPEYIWGNPRPNSEIRILESDTTNASISEVGTIALENTQWGEVGELYLVSDDQSTQNVVTLRSSWNYIAAAEPTFNDMMFSSLWLPAYENKIQLASYNVEDPANPEKAFTVEIDGYLQASRKVGNTLYLVSNYSPYISYIDYFFSTKEDAEENEQKIADLTLQELLPSVRINDGEPQPLVSAGDCLIPQDTSRLTGYHNIVAVTAIDLESNEVGATRCLNTHISGIYSTRDNLYLGGSSYSPWEEFNSYTVIHKFALDEAITYRSTGIVNGTLGWDDPSFRLSEHNNHLRVVSTSRDSSWRPEHHLSILKDSDTSDEMLVVSQLPNEANPDPIGKPNEDIYAVRFDQDRAYIVTFERIDPLYVLDLSDESAPEITGELNITGFSSYLHPVGDDYLLGIGQEANTSGVTQGVKVVLYDIRDMANPSAINTMEFGEQGSWSSALHDLRAISFLANGEDQLRFTLPISTYGTDWQWQDEALHLFEVNGLSSASTPDLNFVGRISSETSTKPGSWPRYSGIDRGVLHQDAVYYTHGDSVWASFWTSPDAATGPH